MAKKEQPKSNNVFIIAGIILVLLLVVGIIGIVVYNRIKAPYNSYKITYSEQLITNSTTQYLTYPGGYLRVSHDGAEAVNSEGLRIWNVSYDMSSPIAAVSGNYATIGDLNGRALYMMDGSGTVYKTEMPYDIEEVECSEVGVSAVRMNDGANDYIQLVNLQGEVLVEIKTLEEKDGFPVDIALSSDGKKLVTSYLVLDKDEAGGWITFYNFGSVGKNYANNVTGVFKYKKVVPKLEFLNSSGLCAYVDDGIKLFSVPETPTLNSEITFDDYIMCASSSNGKVLVMQSAPEAGLVSKTKAYDTKGKLLFEKASSDELKGAMFSGNDILFFNEFACQILAKDGTVRYNGNFSEHNIDRLIPVNGKDKLLLFENGQVFTIQLTKERK